MWAHGDVPRQWDPGIQELSWDIPELHTLWKENPSASGETPDLKNWRLGYWITEMRIQLPYYPELFNIAWYVKVKALADIWTGKSLSKSQLGKMRQPLPSPPHFHIQVCHCPPERPLPLTPHGGMPRLGALPCCTVEGPPGPWGLVPGSGSSTLRAGRSNLQSCTITALVRQVLVCISPVPFSGRGSTSSQTRQRQDEKLESSILHVTISRTVQGSERDNLHYC